MSNETDKFPYPVGLTEEESKKLATTVTRISGNSDGYSTGPSPFHTRMKEHEALLRSLPMEKLVELVNQDKKRTDFTLNRVVCAANYYPGVPLILGPRHWDGTMHAAYDRLVEEYSLKNIKVHGSDFPEGHKFAEGFIDMHGKWLTREEAWVIAEAAGQIIRRVGGDTINGGRLFYENLY